MRPLLLVHGITSNARHTFGTPGLIIKTPKPDSMFSFLTEQGYQPGRTLFWYSYPTLQPLLLSARRLQAEVKKVQAASGSPQIDLLAFSLGGIIGKYYLVSPLYQNEIHKIIMIAPPFHGSPRADWCKTKFNKTKKDFLFAGDSRALSPQILGSNHPLLMELVKHPFPEGIATVIIAMKLVVSGKNDLFTRYHRLINGWIGEGDQTVPVASTKITVNQHYIVVEDYSPRMEHGFLLNNPEIKKIVIRELKKDKADSPEVN